MFKKLGIPLLIAVLGAGCATAPDEFVKTQNEELAELRVALAGLREQEAAKTFRPDLEKAASHIGQAEAQLATGDADEEDVSMLMALARGQMVLVKSMVARTLAEGALKKLSTDYAATQQSILELETKQVDLELDGVKP